MEKNYYYAAEMIEPIDKPIGKTLAVKLYAQVLAKERPHLTKQALSHLVSAFRHDIDMYRSLLDQESAIVHIEDLKNDIEYLLGEIEDLDEEFNGLSPDEIDYKEFDRRNELRAELKSKQQELKTLKLAEKKWRNKDLRFFLATQLMYLTHGKEMPDQLHIAQQTQDYWDARKSKKQLPALASTPDPLHSEKNLSGVEMTQANMTELLQEAGNPDQRNADLWAQCFVEADGDEGKAQALYVKAKMPKPVQPVKGFCPNCTADCRMDAKTCQMCGADFVGGGWKPVLTKPRPTYGAQVHDASPNPNLIKTAKSRGIYIILGLFFGCFGIHNFYAGRYGIGAIQLIITILLGWFVVGFVITAIWALIELVTVKKDGAGDPMA